MFPATLSGRSRTNPGKSGTGGRGRRGTGKLSHRVLGWGRSFALNYLNPKNLIACIPDSYTYIVFFAGSFFC